MKLSSQNLEVTDSYHIENMREIVDWLGRKKISPVFYLKGGSYWAQLHTESKPLIEAGKELGLFQYACLPLESKKPPETFRRLIYNMLGDGNMKDVLDFLDDTNTGSSTI